MINELKVSPSDGSVNYARIHFPPIAARNTAMYPYLLFWHSYAIKPILITKKINPKRFILVMLSNQK